MYIIILYNYIIICVYYILYNLIKYMYIKCIYINIYEIKYSYNISIYKVGYIRFAIVSF